MLRRLASYKLLPSVVQAAAPHLLLSTACALLVTFSSFQFASTSGADRQGAQNRIQRPLTPVPANGFWSLFQPQPGSRLANAILPAVPETESEPGIDEDPEGRSDWFTFQRAYPSNVIPPDARLKAWESQPEYQLNGVVVPQAAQTWRAIGPSPTFSSWYAAWGLTSGRVNSIAVSPVNSRIVIAGSSTGGIWRSTDAGDSFVPVSDDQVDLAVGSLAFSKSNPSIVYAGMGDTKVGYLGSGVLKSTDEGSTWVRVSNSSLPSPGTISKLEIDSANPNRLICCAVLKGIGR